MTLTVQHEPIQGLRAAFLGILADQLRASGHSFTHIDEDHPVPPQIEDFPPNLRAPAFEVKVLSRPMFPRVILSSDEGFQVQIQDDRFSFGWSGDTGYPRYPALRSGFEAAYGEYSSFLSRHDLKQPEVNQLEITYNNRLLAGHGWAEPGELDQVIRSWTQLEGDDLPPIEVARLQQAHLVSDSEGAPFARLYITVEPRSTPIGKTIELDLIFRGRAGSSDTRSILEFFDRGRETIVRAFTSVTTTGMHEVWRRVR